MVVHQFISLFFFLKSSSHTDYIHTHCMLHVKFCIFLSIYNCSVLHLFEQTSFLTRKSLCGFSLYFRVTISTIILAMKTESTCSMESALLYWLAPFETLCHLASDIEHCSRHSVEVTNLNIPRCWRKVSVIHFLAMLLCNILKIVRETIGMYTYFA